MNRSALIRQALERHLKHLRELELEEQDRRGYLAKPQREEEFRIWEDTGREERIERAAKVAGKFSSGRADVSANHDKCLAEAFRQ